MMDKVLLIEDLRQEARRLNFAADVLEGKDTGIPTIQEFADSLKPAAANLRDAMLNGPAFARQTWSKSRMSEAGKEAIRKAQKARWRKFHKSQKGGNRQSK